MSCSVLGIRGVSVPLSGGSAWSPLRGCRVIAHCELSSVRVIGGLLIARFVAVGSCGWLSVAMLLSASALCSLAGGFSQMFTFCSLQLCSVYRRYADACQSLYLFV